MHSDVGNSARVDGRFERCDRPDSRFDVAESGDLGGDKVLVGLLEPAGQGLRGQPRRNTSVTHQAGPGGHGVDGVQLGRSGELRVQVEELDLRPTAGRSVAFAESELEIGDELLSQRGQRMGSAPWGPRPTPGRPATG